MQKKSLHAQSTRTHTAPPLSLNAKSSQKRLAKSSLCAVTAGMGGKLLREHLVFSRSNAQNPEAPRCVASIASNRNQMLWKERQLLVANVPDKPTLLPNRRKTPAPTVCSFFVDRPCPPCLQALRSTLIDGMGILITFSRDDYFQAKGGPARQHMLSGCASSSSDVQR